MQVPDWKDWIQEIPGIYRLELACGELAKLDGVADEHGVWPADLWATTISTGAHLWQIPSEYGGLGLETAAYLPLYAKLAEASLTAAFILSQQDAAVRRLLPSGHRPKIAAMLQSVAHGKVFISIGISQLTTSTRLGQAAMTAVFEPNGSVILNGAMPWVTGALQAQAFVTGGVAEDGRQVLVVVPRDRAGVSVPEALPLAALQASCTGEVHCRQVRVEPDEVLAGPAPEVMKIPGLAGTGGLETSALALGQARAALQALAAHSGEGPEQEAVSAIAAQWETLARHLVSSAAQKVDSMPAAEIRRQANALVNRAAQAYLTAKKGAGFLRTDPAQRWARQSLFFLVWSCPSPIARASIRDLAGLCPS